MKLMDIINEQSGRFVYVDGRKYFIIRKTDGNFYRQNTDIHPTDKFRIQFNPINHSLDELKVFDGKRVSQMNVPKCLSYFQVKMCEILNADITTMDRSENYFGLHHISYYDRSLDRPYVAELRLLPIDEKCDIDGNRVLGEQITSVPLLRKLSYKSKLNFGKFNNLTVQEILNLNRKSYLRFIYYNYEGISFIDDILRELKIYGDDYDDRISKPGKDPELGNELSDLRYQSFDDKIKKNLEKRQVGQSNNKMSQFTLRDKIGYSKGNLQRRNHGH